MCLYILLIDTNFKHNIIINIHVTLDDRYLDGGIWKWNHQIKKGRIFKGEGLDPFNTQSPFRIIW